MSASDGHTNEVLVAAHAAVDALSVKARERLAGGAYFIRLPRWEAQRLIAAVDAMNEANAEANHEESP